MFERLVQFGRYASRSKVAASSSISVVLHAAIIAAAVVATAYGGASRERAVLDTTLVFLPERPQPEKPRPREPPTAPITLKTPLKGFQTVVALNEIPTEIPPVNLAERFNPGDYSGIGVEGGVAEGVIPGAEQVYAINVVSERPELLAAPVPAYPAVLRQAGVQGEVVVETVVDTLGRVEAATIRVVSSTHPLFTEPAVVALRQSVFRPARVYGRAVRVLVRIPYRFVIR